MGLYVKYPKSKSLSLILLEIKDIELSVKMVKFRRKWEIEDDRLKGMWDKDHLVIRIHYTAKCHVFLARSFI